MNRVLNFLFALLLSPILLPIVGAIWLWIRLAEDDDAFYIAERAGQDCKPFGLIKFRTMSHDPEDSGVTGGDKAKRITPIGRKLRRYRLDELPQIINVLKGDINFVGPRPPLMRYVQAFPDIYGPLLKERPGITGLASILYHRREEALLSTAGTAAETEHLYSNVCVPAKARLDRWYQQRRTCWLDFRILWMTIHRTGREAPVKRVSAPMRRLVRAARNRALAEPHRR
ncbi:sugar transferase [Paracoccaceae bacterium GXU_MW_L88]